MQLIRDFSHIPASAKGAAIALGNFDGLHLGHRSILEETLEHAKRRGMPAAVMIFEPHPREFFNPQAPKLRLMRLREKMDGFREMGFDFLFMPRFNQSFAATSAEAFVNDYLVGALAAKHIVTGSNFYFGAKRGGNSAFLAKSAVHHRFTYHAMPQVANDAGVISSTAIRRLLAEGNVLAAAQLLGHPYRICGHVTHGDKRGRTLGFPTANIPLSKLFLPRAGVYAVRVRGSGTGDQKGVVNIGVRPTVGGTKPQAEIHLFDFSGDLYGKYVRIELQSFLRDEQKFDSLDALKNQIALDCEKARAIT